EAGPADNDGCPVVVDTDPDNDDVHGDADKCPDSSPGAYVDIDGCEPDIDPSYFYWAVAWGAHLTPNCSERTMEGPAARWGPEYVLEEGYWVYHRHVPTGETADGVWDMTDGEYEDFCTTGTPPKH